MLGLKGLKTEEPTFKSIIRLIKDHQKGQKMTYKTEADLPDKEDDWAEAHHVDSAEHFMRYFAQELDGVLGEGYPENTKRAIREWLMDKGVKLMLYNAIIVWRRVKNEDSPLRTRKDRK